MNITSVLVGGAMAAMVSPHIAEMSIAPMVAAKRAENFGVAEAAAVTFAASHEGTTKIPEDTDICVAEDLGNQSYKVTCTEGAGRFLQSVSRSFRLEVASTTYTNPNRNFAFETPDKFSHVQCHPNDPWGVIWYNDHLKAGHMDACIPTVAWNRNKYLDSNPDDWLFDISNFGFGQHPDY